MTLIRDNCSQVAPPAAYARMPVVSALVDLLSRDQFRFGDNVWLFGVQHLMEQSIGLCCALNKLGIPFGRMALCGKPYSSNGSVLAELSNLGVMVVPWRQYSLQKSQAQEQVVDLRCLLEGFLQKIAVSDDKPIVLVIDDGGLALINFAESASKVDLVAGVEQTASGFWQANFESIPFPVVDVGASAVKRIHEPRIVVEAALERVRSRLPRTLDGLTCGVVGLGYIGAALAEMLISEGAEVCVYDTRPDSEEKWLRRRAENILDVFDRSEVIFGCTGTDITKDLLLPGSVDSIKSGSKTLISVSSGDDEFFSLKNRMIESSRLHGDGYNPDNVPDIVGKYAGSEFRILRNGFPINFDNSLESAPLEDIQGTIAALVGAVCQAYQYAVPFAPPVQRLMLDVAFQRWLWGAWVEGSPTTLGAGQTLPIPRASEIVSVSASRTLPVSVDMGSHFGPWTDVG